MEKTCGFSLMEPPASPRSPPAGLDLYGKRRQMVKVQVLEREISLLQEELKSVQDIQPASTCCKELDDFIVAKPDPLVAKKQESQKHGPLWKRLWRKFCSGVAWICCCSCCVRHRVQLRNCCTCYLQCDPQCPSCICSGKITCQECSKCTALSCLQNACCCFKCGHRCTKVNLCSNSSKCCGNTCCL